MGVPTIDYTDDTFVLDEGSLRTAWPSTTRFIPVATGEGEPPKVAIYGIGPVSALARMGLRNGDALLRLGGVPVDGPDAAFEAFARLSNDRLLRITFEREGALREHLVRLE